MLCGSLVAIDYNLKVISHMQNVEEFFLSVQEEHTYTIERHSINIDLKCANVTARFLYFIKTHNITIET